jgi:hypothetical protein
MSFRAVSERSLSLLKPVLLQIGLLTENVEVDSFYRILLASTTLFSFLQTVSPSSVFIQTYFHKRIKLPNDIFAAL